ncbi:hypothetical protein [Fibrobacter sp.]|uniref:hypothetical protein n=1 Tax=Fibrobacter sp. TaxID=35828 RepID=UPI0038902B88
MTLAIVPVLIAVLLCAFFPLSDTDIWWHLACGREWISTWTPVREPVVNVHEFFQQSVYAVYGVGGAPLLVVFKALLWSLVFYLFLRPVCKEPKGGENYLAVCVSVILLFVFRYQMEMRPIVFSLVFLGFFWNLLPFVFGTNSKGRKILGIAVLLLIQWAWCRCQGLYILGPILAFAFVVGRRSWANAALVVALFAMPFLHSDGLNLFLYPFGLLDRLLGLSPSAAVFASQIAENRSPFTVAFAGENLLQSVGMVLVGGVTLVWSVVRLARRGFCVHYAVLFTVAVMSLVAERNFVLLMPLLVLEIFKETSCVPVLKDRRMVAAFVVVCSVFLGLWVKCVKVYDSSMVSYRRVPVNAALWMKTHPHAGKLFNDDRSGGYLEFVNPADPVFIDGRFILKTREFFERYLLYSEQTNLFEEDAAKLDVDRAVFPLRYFSRWENLVQTLERGENWRLAYVDSLYVIFDRVLLR